MLNVVLLRGYLSKEVFEEAFQEIKWLDDEESKCVLVIDSDGGDFVPAMEFVRKVKKLDIRFVLKIYNAQSAAAFILLSLLREDNEYAEMKRGSRISFHRGYLNKLEVSELSDEGQVPLAMLRAIRAYNDELDMLLKQWGIEDPKLLAELHGSGWFNLSTERCLQYGIVRELF